MARPTADTGTIDTEKAGRAPGLGVRDLACRRGGRLVFENLHFDLEAGDALVLRGANGSGKSSLLRMLAGFLEPAGGEIRWDDGEGADEDGAAGRRRSIHYVGHRNAIKPLLTVQENLAFATALAGAPAGAGSPRLVAALETFDLLPHASTPGRLLSQGQQRRAALARLVAAPRTLWLLDEPGVGLDRRSRQALERLIAAHLAEGGICVAATHGDVALDDPLVLDLGG